MDCLLLISIVKIIDEFLQLINRNDFAYFQKRYIAFFGNRVAHSWKVLPPNMIYSSSLNSPRKKTCVPKKIFEIQDCESIMLHYRIFTALRCYSIILSAVYEFCLYTITEYFIRCFYIFTGFCLIVITERLILLLNLGQFFRSIFLWKFCSFINFCKIKL